MLRGMSAAIAASVRRQRIADVLSRFVWRCRFTSKTAVASANESELKAFARWLIGWAQMKLPPRKLRQNSYVDHLFIQEGEEHCNLDVNRRAACRSQFRNYSALLVITVLREAVQSSLIGDGGENFSLAINATSLLKSGHDFDKPWPMRMALYMAGKHGLGRKRSDVIVARTPGHYYFEVNSRLKDGDLRRMAPGLKSFPPVFDIYASNGARRPLQLANYSRRAEFYGQCSGVFKKVDMASMHHSLEVRVPLLDRQVIELSLRIDPFELCVAVMRKSLLRQMLRSTFR